MIYFTMRYKNERNRLYYMYVNDDFDKIETEPQLLFEYPIENKTAIEGGVMSSTNFTQPKHGAVVHLTKKEAKKLAKQWGLDYNKLAK